MYCVQNRIYCGDCINTYLAKNYPIKLKTQGHVNSVLKDHCTTSTIVEAQFIEKKWKQILLIK